MTYYADLYMHDRNKQAFNALNIFPQFVRLQRAYVAYVDEVAARIEFLSTAIRLGDKQMSDVYSYLPPISEKLGIELLHSSAVNSDAHNNTMNRDTTSELPIIPERHGNALRLYVR